MRLKIIIAAFILILALKVRTINLDEPYIRAFDPYYMLRVARSEVREGRFNPDDNLRYYPVGWDSKDLQPVTTRSISSLCLDPSTCHIKFLAKWQPVIYGILSVIVLAAIGVRFYDSVLLPTMFLSLMPAFLYRTASGFADKDAVTIFLMVLSLYFFYRSQKDSPFLFGIFSGLALGIGSLSGGSFFLYFVPMAIYVFFQIYRKKVDKKLLAIIPVSVISILVSATIPKFPLLHTLKSPFGITAAGASALAIVSYLVFQKTKYSPQEKKYLSFVLTFILGIVSFYALGGSDIFATANRAYQLILHPIATPGAIAHSSSVGEQQAPSWSWPNLSGNDYFRNFHYLMFIAPLVFILPLIYKWKDKELPNSDLITISWLLFSLYAASTAVRMFFVAAPAVAFAAAAAVKRLLGIFDNDYIKVSVYSLILLIAIFPRVGNFTSMYTESEIMSRTVLTASMNPPWFENLKWMNENIEEQEPILTWWDYGYWLQTVADRKSLGDGANTEPYQVNYITGSFFANSTIERSEEWMREESIEWVTADNAMIGKFYWISRLGGNGTQYMVFPFVSTQKVGFEGKETDASIYNAGNNQILINLQVNGTSVPILSAADGSSQAVVEYVISPVGIYKTPVPEDFPKIPGGVVFGGDAAVYAEPTAMNSMFTRLFFTNGLGTGLELFFDNDFTKTYKLLSQ